MKKGQKTRKTLEKEATLELLRQKVSEQIRPLVEAQIDSAVGLKHFFLRDPKSGRFERITNEAVIERAMNEGAEGSHFWIYTKDPSTGLHGPDEPHPREAGRGRGRGGFTAPRDRLRMARLNL